MDIAIIGAYIIMRANELRLPVSIVNYIAARAVIFYIVSSLLEQ